MTLQQHVASEMPPAMLNMTGFHPEQQFKASNEHWAAIQYQNVTGKIKFFLPTVKTDKAVHLLLDRTNGLKYYGSHSRTDGGAPATPVSNAPIGAKERLKELGSLTETNEPIYYPFNQNNLEIISEVNEINVEGGGKERRERLKRCEKK